MMACVVALYSHRLRVVLHKEMPHLTRHKRVIRQLFPFLQTLFQYSSHVTPTVITTKPATRRIDVDDPNFRSLFTPELEKLSSIFLRYDYELRIAGGAVRDLLMGRRPGDVDFATTATPAEMLEIFKAEEIRVVHDRGAAHGTLMVRVDDKENFEVTTSRIHVEEQDLTHADDPKPAGFTRQFTRDWYLDSCQRDLTINAMFLTLDGLLVDYHRGEEDLQRRHVRFVGDARHRIREDHQRILRYFRFRTQLASELRHDEETLRALREEGPGLKKLAGMRIWPELKKLLKFPTANQELETVWRLDLFSHCGLPKNVSENKINEFSKKWSNSYDLQPLPLTALSPLFSDDRQVDKLCKRTINVSKAEKQLLLWLIQHREDFADASMKTLRDYVVDHPSSLHSVTELLKLENRRQDLREMEEWGRGTIPTFPVTPFHLMVKGFEGGAKVRENLAKLNHVWKESGYAMSKDELIGMLVEERERELGGS